MATINRHWNYFLSLERDLENLTRYIEFTVDNYDTYSTELTQILLSASSEIDVLMKQLCNSIDPSVSVNNINDYKNLIMVQLADFADEEVFIERYALSFKPFEEWKTGVNPAWWTSYNKVKHERNTHYKEANLENTLKAISGLLLTVLFFYKYNFTSVEGRNYSIKCTTFDLEPKSTLIFLKPDYYNSILVCE